jgi:indole-3-glycerol phosphate synthase
MRNKALFVKTDTILDKILAHKQTEIAECYGHSTLAHVQAQAAGMPPAQDFAAALHGDTVALIAEIKKASPSKGVLIENFDPAALAQTYTQNGAAALSVLADEQFFGGNIRNLAKARAVSPLPILCKEFIIDPYQIYEARAYHADAVLLIVMALEQPQLADLHALIRELGMAALVEVHNEDELERALAIGATLIGVNNRDLRTFVEDLDTTARVAARVPADVTLVAESAIRTPDDVRRMGQLGAHAVLVGEGLVKSGDIGAQVRAFSSQAR